MDTLRAVRVLLEAMVERGASDGFIMADAPLSIKVDGQLQAMNDTLLTEADVAGLIRETMTAEQEAQFDATRECNYAIVDPHLGRFRASAYIQRGRPGLVMRRISEEIPGFEELGLPKSLEKLAMLKRGLVILVGATGTGKSTTLASMLDYRNTHSQGHIITVEDPIEYVHRHKGCLVSQREVGIDTESYEVALANTLRQAPDVIMIGEVRTAKTMETALAFAETGHLCLCTLHANNAYQALDRIQSFFAASQLNQIWMDLSLNLRAMVAQQLLPSRSGGGRVPIVEVMLGSPLVLDHIRKGEVHMIKEVMARSTELGMQTFDQSLIEAYKAGLITAQDAERHADSANDVRLAIKLFEKGSHSIASSGDFSLDLG